MLLDLLWISWDLRIGAPLARHCKASPAALGVGFGHQTIPCKPRTVRTVPRAFAVLETPRARPLHEKLPWC